MHYFTTGIQIGSVLPNYVEQIKPDKKPTRKTKKQKRKSTFQVKSRKRDETFNTVIAESESLDSLVRFYGDYDFTIIANNVDDIVQIWPSPNLNRGRSGASYSTKSGAARKKSRGFRSNS